jgi:hypothetical protein
MKRRGKSEEGRVKVKPPVFTLIPSPFSLHREIL